MLRARRGAMRGRAAHAVAAVLLLLATAAAANDDLAFSISTAEVCSVPLGCKLLNSTQAPCACFQCAKGWEATGAGDCGELCVA